MVFALASKMPAAKYVPGISRPCKDEPSFTSYDIWCAGIFPETFPFTNNDGPAYWKMLNRTCFPGHEYHMGRTEIEMGYPKDVPKKKSNLLWFFNPLLEKGVEHQLHFIEEEDEGGPTAASAA